MITVGTYSRLEDAQNDANKLGKRGIEVHIVDIMGSSIIPGTGPHIELQIPRSDIEKLKALSDEIHEQTVSEHSYQCPHCGSKNYAPYTSTVEFLSIIKSIFRRRVSVDPNLYYQCLDCGGRFKRSLEP